MSESQVQGASIDAPALRAALAGADELALLDLREVGTFSRRHILYANPVPLSRLELLAPQRVPRPGTPVVVCDAGEGLAERGAERLRALGYADVKVLHGGVDAWQAAGFELFSGVNVPSKAFGEIVEHRFGTPSVSAEELHAMLEAGADVAVLDSRPMPEFNRYSIPTGVCVPGAELAYRVHDLVPSPDTTVVVNCAGRTRSIIGAQSLINAGIPNPVVALRNGTMGWQMAGYEVATGETRSYGPPSAEALARARERAEAVAERFGVSCAGPGELERWRADAEAGLRSLFVLDVRSPEEYASGHLPGSRSAPGGQLVQATDGYVGTLRARIALVDDTGVRARMTGAWLAQMGWRDLMVVDGALDAGRLETGPEPQLWAGLESVRVKRAGPREVRALLAGGGADVIDLSLSRVYRAGHVPGARFAVRSRLHETLAKLDGDGPLVLVSEDGSQALLAAADLAGAGSGPPGTAAPAREVVVLDGGMQAWRAAGLDVVRGDESWADEPDDVWLAPMERGADLARAMQDYLTWEVALVEQVERDGTAPFLHEGGS